MTQFSSSTSSSDPVPSKAESRPRDCLIVGIGFLATILTFDLSVDFLFEVPGDQSARELGSLHRYFEYGRSVEGKVRRMTGPQGRIHPLFKAGWIEEAIRAAPRTDSTMTVYGMSFAARAGKAALEFLDGYELRMIGGPAAPLSHSYYAFQKDEHWRRSKVVVLGILASSLPKIQSMTHMTGSWEGPAPHTYPRYTLDGRGALRAIEPVLNSEEEFCRALADDAKWTEFVTQLAAHDSYFDPFVFHRVLDSSPLFRLVRRGWGQSQSRVLDARFHSPAGFAPDVVDVARAIVAAFVAQARDGGRPLVVILFDDRGYADHLDQALAPVLEASDVHFVSSHRAAPATNLANFLPDGHFRPDIDRELGRRLASAIRDAVGR